VNEDKTLENSTAGNISSVDGEIKRGEGMEKD